MLGNETKPNEDRRVKHNRQRIQQAFVELLAEKDFHKIAVQEIAERADINRATFYAHFEDKYTLLNYHVRDELQAMLDQHLPQAANLTLANLRLLAVTVGEFMAQFWGGCHPTTRTDQHPTSLILPQVHEYVYEILLGWIRKAHPGGGDQARVSPQHMASTLSWVILGAVLPLRRTDHKESLETMVDQMMRFLVPSLELYFSGFAGA